MSSVLTEDLILSSSRQYDIELVHELRLRSRKLKSLAEGVFRRCTCLCIVDVSRNELTTLSGFQLLANTLEYLNASENKLTDISALSPCTKLTTVCLEGNDMRYIEALRSLNEIPALNQVRVSKVIALDSSESLTLDNPFCATTSPEDYAKMLKTAKWVDDFYLDHYRADGAAKGDDNSSSGGGGDGPEKPLPTPDQEIEKLKSMSAKVTEESSEERSLEKILQGIKNLA